MKIIGISDIHGNFRDIPECEVLCICGDIVNLNDQRDMDASRHWWYNRFTSWVNRQPCEKVIITAGNHDFFLEDAYKRGYLQELKNDLSARTNGKLVILINEEYTYKDVKFYGCPFIRPITFQEGRWAFEDDYDTVEDKEKSCYDGIPKDTDILLTHDSPGYNTILGYKKPNSTMYHLFGHWHDGISLPSLREYNCSILNDMYNFKQNFKYQEIDFEREESVTQEDEIPLPVTADILEEENGEDENRDSVL